MLQRNLLVGVIMFVMLVWSALVFAEEPVFMSAEWAKQTCEEWNKDKVLTENLLEWSKNDKGRGFKILQIYRKDCPNDPWVELKIQNKDNKVICSLGGEVTQKPDLAVDYIMYADTNRWMEMGKGQYGPMWAMTTGRLKFSGPMWEAMKNMGPFNSFLQLMGKVPSDTKKCNK